MQTLASFSENDLERLYLTYKRNFKNYSKIKNKVIGKDAEKQYRRNKKSGIFFFIAVTFIIAVSSVFSLVSDHMNSFVALWMIWAIAAVLFSIGFGFFHKNSSKILQKNQAFFDKFEAIASNNESLEDFRMNW